MDIRFLVRDGWILAGTSGYGDFQVKQPLLVATRNKDKLKELRELLRDLPVDLQSLGDFPGAVDISETGVTFAENASLKATGYAAQIHLTTLADDSGLEVDALGGSPGCFSARYASEGATYA